MEIESTIDFLKEIEKFKTCERECRTTADNRAESDAEHSWHLAIFLILLENEFDKIRYALSMVFIKVTSKELSHNGERKARNALLVILKRHFREKVSDVYVSGLNITRG